MEPVQQWTGRTACALQQALRMSNDSFAAHLGIAVRTIAMWHQKPGRVPNSEIQQALDTTLERAGDGAKARFAKSLTEFHTPDATKPLPDGSAPAVQDQTAATSNLTGTPSSAISSGEVADAAADGDFMGWLQVAHEATAPPDGSDVGQILRWYRKHEKLTQQEFADVLNTTQSRLSKLEKGTQALKDVAELRYIARKVGIPPERLGVLPDQSRDASPFPSHVTDRPGKIRDSQERWREIRRELNGNRAMLGDLAAELYPQQRIPGTTVLTSSNWVPDGPVDLSDIELIWRTESPSPQIGGRAPESAGSRPLMANGERYSRYSRALRDLARPRLLDNRVSYRLLDVKWVGSRGVLGFNYTSYFDVLDVGEALGHELAEAWLNAGRKRPSLADLPFRRSIIDPFDLSARPILPSINTLTIRRDSIEGHRMYLHRRDAKSVAAAGGMYHVVPAGVFQPAALAPAHQANDFSLWRNVQREFSEEFLGNAEHDGNSVDPIAYETDEPFSSFERARRAGDFQVFACAMVLEPLTLWVELLTVAIIAAPVFDELFSKMVSINEEGAAISTESGRPTTGIPFTADARERLRSEPLSPISRACIELAWKYRYELLGR